MASDFSSKFTAAAMPKLLDRMGESVTYATVAGSSVTRSAIVNVSSDGLNWTAIFDIASDSTTGVAAPAKGDRITYDTNVWTVVEVIPNYAGGHEIHAVLPRLTQ